MKRQQLKNLNNLQWKWFPLHPTASYNIHDSKAINDFVEKYHCSSWIQFQDGIQFEDSKQYLKRFYKNVEFTNKIKLLSDYYRYHFQVPRIFMEGVARILQDNVDDRREIQFAIVTKEMNKQDQQDFPTINTHRGIEKHQRLIKDVELSYEDFEQKPLRKQKQVEEKIFTSRQQNVHANNEVQKPISRVDSMKFKGSFMVFKPKHQHSKQNLQKQNNAQQKYKKPKQIRSKDKEKEKKKSQATIKEKLKNTDTGNNEKIKAKNNSKLTSVNNSLASNKGLSRSKSRTHLNLGGLKTKNLENQNKGQEKCFKNKQKSNCASLQNSLGKSCSKKDILCQKKAYKNVIPKKGEKINLKIEDKANKNDENEIEKVPKILSRKQSQSNIETNKKMFNRVIQIKRKKQ